VYSALFRSSKGKENTEGTIKYFNLTNNVKKKERKKITASDSSKFGVRSGRLSARDLIFSWKKNYMTKHSFIID